MAYVHKLLILGPIYDRRWTLVNLDRHGDLLSASQLGPSMEEFHVSMSEYLSKRAHTLIVCLEELYDEQPKVFANLIIDLAADLKERNRLTKEVERYVGYQNFADVLKHAQRIDSHVVKTYFEWKKLRWSIPIIIREGSTSNEEFADVTPIHEVIDELTLQIRNGKPIDWDRLKSVVDEYFDQDEIDRLNTVYRTWPGNLKRPPYYDHFVVLFEEVINPMIKSILLSFTLSVEREGTRHVLKWARENLGKEDGDFSMSFIRYIAEWVDSVFI